MKNLVLALILSALLFGDRARGAEEEFDAILNTGYKRKIVDGVKMTTDGEAIFTSSDTVEPAPCVFDEGAEIADGSKIDEVPLNNTDIDILNESHFSGAVYCLDGKKDGSSTKRPYKERLGSSRRHKRNVRKSIDKYRWPSTTINYRYDYGESVPSALRESVNQAIEEYSKYTCIKFKEVTTQKPCLSIVNDGGCWSYVGYIHYMANYNNGQKVSLSGHCYNSKRTPIHEFFHALGSYHQQSRPDRDAYVTIDLSYIPSKFYNNFDKHTDAQVDLFGTPYSYRSVMHYNKLSVYGRNTITTKDPTFQNIIGHGPTFSFEDLFIINTFYRCDSHCTGPNTCKTSTRLSYRGKDCQCYCDNDDQNPDVPAVICPNNAPTDGSSFSSDGTATIPLVHSKLQSRFENNGASMYAGGMTDESAGIETPTLGPGTWCVQFSANVNDGAVGVDRSGDDFANYRYAGFYNIGRTTTWHPKSYKFTSSAPNYKIRIRGYMPEAIAKHRTDTWSLGVKDVKVYKCKP